MVGLAAILEGLLIGDFWDCYSFAFLLRGKLQNTHPSSVSLGFFFFENSILNVIEILSTYFQAIKLYSRDHFVTIMIADGYLSLFVSGNGTQGYRKRFSVFWLCWWDSCVFIRKLLSLSFLSALTEYLNQLSSRLRLRVPFKILQQDAMQRVSSHLPLRWASSNNSDFKKNLYTTL